MNYQEGIEFMKGKASKLEPNESDSFNVGNLTINYPGKKSIGDYRLTINGKAPTHTDVVYKIYNGTTTKNFNKVVHSLEDVYKNGLNATTKFFSKSFIELIYWITLQEEINYPPPKLGRKLPFQRFYEGALAKVSSKCELNDVLAKTNNHGLGVPTLYSTDSFSRPSFYA
ncbi:hypothetical protein [Flagellimonas meishanensis]|uniref:hypothetical protein n=1 Tax=Flagellimonas meishanensis TaxID=2873264 RepID=UPI001CA66C80|nr:hypothetical protein [[Muricauda] meishanensis]